jgi:hypothetical protein
LSQAMVHTIAESTHICSHDPADVQVHALRPHLLQRLVRAVAFPTAVGEGMNVLLLDRAQHHRHCPLDAGVLKRRPPARSLAAICLVEPRPLHRRRRIAPAAPPRIQVREVRLQVFRRGRGRHPITPRRRLVAGPALGFPPPVDVPQVGQRRDHQRWILDRLRRDPLACG